MSWSQVTATTESWNTAVTTQGSWTTSDVSLVPPPWAMLSSVTTSVDVGVDFGLRLREQYPMYISADRPIALYDVYPEGTP